MLQRQGQGAKDHTICLIQTSKHDR